MGIGKDVTEDGAHALGRGTFGLSHPYDFRVLCVIATRWSAQIPPAAPRSQPISSLQALRSRVAGPRAGSGQRSHLTPADSPDPRPSASSFAYSQAPFSPTKGWIPHRLWR